jgi:ATP-dependent Clp protease ATP-binding subunit ClpC
MTSNIGTRELKDFGRGVGFKSSESENTSNDYSKSVIQKALKKAFAPEFLNRIDDVIMFNSLTREHIHLIIEIELKGLFDRIHNLGYIIELTPEAKDYVAEKGYDVQYGARPLKRAIQKYLEDEMAEVILKSEIQVGDTIQVDYSKPNDEIVVKIIKKDDKEKAKPEGKANG